MATVVGTEGDDTISAGSASFGVNPPTGATNGPDLIFAIDGADTVRAGDGNDTLFGQNGPDFLSGDAGNDRLEGDFGGDTLFGGDGIDRVFGSVGPDFVSGGDGNDIVQGGTEDDLVFGGFGDDFVNGGPDNDALFGDSGMDQLSGDTGNDRLRGGPDSDRLTGGSDNDTFIFVDVLDSSPVARDTVFGVEGIGAPNGDVFNVSAIDADTSIFGNQVFTFIGAAPFSAAGQVRVADAGGGNTLIQGNVDSNLAANLEVLVQDGVTDPQDYTAGDFIL